MGKRKIITAQDDSQMGSVVQLKSPDTSEYKEASDGGIWDADISKTREAQAKTLIDTIVMQENPCTISLNASWGLGKTFFLTRLVCEYCKEIGDGAKERPSAIYFNAWKDDFVSDPLLSVIGQLAKDTNLQRYSKLLDEIKSAAAPLFAQAGLGVTKYLAKVLLQKTTGIDPEAIKEAFELSLGDITSLTEKNLNEKYKDLCESREVLRGKLGKLVQKNWDDTHRPLLIVVDELDRCRPIFAIELLERIKHLFDVPHLVFLIGMDACQLMKSLKSVYGDINTQDYLLRFIDVETTLPPFSKDDFIAMLWRKLGYDKLILPGDSDVVYKDGDSVLEKVKLLARVCNLTLRQIEQCIRLFLFLARPYKQSASVVSSEMIAVGIVLKVIDAGMYERFLNWDFKVWELVDCIIPARIDDPKRDFVDVKNLIGELYRLACSVSPMGVLRQNLSWFAAQGKAISSSNKEDFELPKIIKNLPPQEWQGICVEYADRMGLGPNVHHEYLKRLRSVQEQTMGVLKEAFMLF